MDGGEGRRVGSDLRGTTAIPSFSACAPATIPGCLGPAGECCEFHGVPAAGFGDLPPRHGGHEAGACNAVLFPSLPINTSNFQPRVTPMNPIFFKFDKSKERDLSYNLSSRSDKKNLSLGTGRIGYSIRSVRNEPPSPPSRESSSRNGILAPRYPL